MRRFLMSAIVVAMGLTVAGTAQAGGVRVGGSVSHSRTVTTSRPAIYASTTWNASHIASFRATYATPFIGGYFYRGIGFNHWTYTCWSSRYRCPLYWDPCFSCYYYWCQPAGCYYPITYIASAPPVVVATTPLVGVPVVDSFPPPPPAAQ